MKTIWVFIGVIGTVSALHAYKSVQSSGIGGKVSPANAARDIWAIKGNDSIRIYPANGVFHIKSKPGNYKVFIDARDPYKNVVIESVQVLDGTTTDLGDIRVIQ